MSFRHEKFVERGGPDGGDGGDGANIVVKASNNQNTLAKYRFKKEITAENGANGSKRKKHGRTASDMILDVPVGTVILDKKNNLIADLVNSGQTAVIAIGGRGGFGNAHFISSTRQAPRIAEKGEPGEELEATLELKMIADVGLVGLPNAGKSTLLSRISNAQPEIANYPFTTLRPNLGVVDIGSGEKGFLVADIPGLIEGASQGKGLGDEFLRHVERTKLLIHVIDCYQNDIETNYKTIQNELKEYNKKLAKLPQIIALNKIDGLDDEIVQDQVKKLKTVAKKNTILTISALSGTGIKELIFAGKKLLDKTTEKSAKKIVEEIPVITLDDKDDSWTVKKTAKGFIIKGMKIERFAKRTDFDSDEGIKRLRDIMAKMGIIKELERRKIRPSERIMFGNLTSRWIEY